MKMVAWLTAGTLAFLSVVLINLDFASGQTPPAKTSELLSRGKKIYEEKCAICHGAQGNAQTPMAQVLKPLPRDFTQPLTEWAVSKGEPVKIFKVIKEGIPNSPMVKFDLPDEDVWALVHTVREFSTERK